MEHVWRSENKFLELLSPSTLWVLRIRIRSPDLAASIFDPLSHFAGPNIYFYGEKNEILERLRN